MTEKKYSYDRFGSKGARVGQAVYDIISKDQPSYTAEEILEEMGKNVLEYIQDASEKGCEAFDTNFKIIHIFKKSLGMFDVHNAMQQKAICFVDGPTNPSFYMEECPHAAKSLYEVDKVNGVVKLLWTVPGIEDCASIKKNPHLYDKDLVRWVKEATSELFHPA
jgi:hypothetical protein